MLLLRLHLLLQLLASWAPGGQGFSEQKKPALPPLIPHRPFLVVWNAPAESCRMRFHVDLSVPHRDLNETSMRPQ
ncbi:hypothetical protein NHX12_002688 [Muraenolepis orangiensis]|uniref:hyaluronoglucosaminidase n=1 Tax=Muraenolepis orangiensis TaxID=630683 RepID=A0A9Q0DXI3_9TELE|nr:hypothetical protein NHX12_002688 [Muraenolepis orangiensis]